uniref:Aquaporin 11 n=1 Tax=Sphenodon punctatus TaxID=8508 RepID=A0A8D0GYB2_SPHPU
MAVDEIWVSPLVMAAVMLLTAACRAMTRHLVHHIRHLGSFLLEMFASLQVCACTNELRLLADMPPAPHVALTLTYVLTVLHGLTLSGSTINPSSTLEQLLRSRISLKMSWVKTAAQFTGAVGATFFMSFIWSLKITKSHSGALAQDCSNPIQTTITEAFALELLFSFLFHLAVLQFDSVKFKMKVHLIALLITILVYGGGHLTGAVFNPALALSLHASCFRDKFWDYALVYWMAPCLGTVLVVIVWDELIPMLQ